MEPLPGQLILNVIYNGHDYYLSADQIDERELIVWENDDLRESLIVGLWQHYNNDVQVWTYNGEKILDSEDNNEI